MNSESTRPTQPEDTSFDASWSLIALSPELGDLSVPLGVSTSVGRHQDNDIVLASQQISRQHAKFNQIGSKLVVQDLGSSNGTFVNGQRIATDAVELENGDEVGFADILFVVANEAMLESTDQAMREIVSPSQSLATDTTEAITEVVTTPATVITADPVKQPIVEPTPVTTTSVDTDKPIADHSANIPAATTAASSPVTDVTSSPNVSDSQDNLATVTKTPPTSPIQPTITEPVSSPVVPVSNQPTTATNPVPVAPKAASTQTWLVAVIIVVLIVLAIIFTLFLK